MNDLKRQICHTIDLYKDEIIAIGEEVLAAPELGYKEYATSLLVQKIFKNLNLPYTTGHALTGVKAWLKGRTDTRKLCIIGEMDAVLCPTHPFADPITGAAHACGHHAQIASMLGAAIGLVHSHVMEHLDGDICLFATPAEEYVEIAYRQQLIQKGKITFLGGKQELLALGDFDDIDITMMTHSENTGTTPRVVIEGNSLGFIGKTIRFIGKEAHAGGAPHEGINALNAATIAIMCINAQRETFRDCDGIRVHPIITKGGDLVNIVPADVQMESYVRGKNIPAIQDANHKVNRAITGACYAIGAKAQIDDLVGYLPLCQNPPFSQVFGENVKALLGEEALLSGLDFAGSTDMGDLSYVMPVIQPTISGFAGAAHSKDFSVVHKELAYIIPAKLMAMTAIDLLSNGATLATQIKDSMPRKSTAQYEALWQAILKPDA